MILWWIMSCEKKEKQSKGNVNEVLEKTIDRGKTRKCTSSPWGSCTLHAGASMTQFSAERGFMLFMPFFSSIFAILPPAKIVYLSHAHFLLPGKTSTGSHQSGFIKIQVRQTQSLNTDIHIIFKNIFFH